MSMPRFKTYAHSKIMIPDTVSIEQQEKAYNCTSRFELPSIKQPDLLYMEDILVSTGANLNDDVFLPEEVIKAIVYLDTVILKPVNWEHNPANIIGTMFDSFIIDKKGNRVDSNFDELSEFDVVSQSVIWSSISQQHREWADQIIAAAGDNSLFVSMEAFFSDYDFLVGDQIIQRNERTDFLTSALRVHGGPGHYNNKRVKRVLRNIIFSGKGIVEEPANPPSEIRAVASDLDGRTIPESCIISELPCIAQKNTENSDACSITITGAVFDADDDTGISADDDTLIVKNNKGDNKSDNNVEADPIVNDETEKRTIMEKELKELQDKLEAVLAENKALNDKIANSSLTEAESKISELEAKNTDLAKRIEDLDQKIADSEEISKELDDVKADLAKANEEIEKLTSVISDRDNEDRLVARKEAILEIVTLTDEELTGVLAKVKECNDEEFDAYLEDCKLFASKGNVEVDETDASDNTEDVEDADEDDTEDNTDEADAADILDDVQADTNQLPNSEKDTNTKSKFRGLFSGGK